jgi:hypothetical protein
MRAAAVLALMILAAPAHADTVKGFCERGGKRLEFSDGIAFADAKDEKGAVTTTIYLTAEPIDRAELAKCTECAGPLGENTFTSPRGDLVETQKKAISAGWMELQHVGGELDMTSIVNLMYIADDGTHTGLDGGNGSVKIEAHTATRIAGKVGTQAREAGMNETDMNCAVTFDLALGWPKKK